MPNNPAITNNKLAISILHSPKGDLTKGFSIVGPFESLMDLLAWAQSNITQTEYDTPFWNVIQITAPQVSLDSSTFSASMS